jgi:hypothetical protein
VNRDHSAKVSPLSKRGLHGAWEVRDPQDPQTPEEWQECVNLAAGWRQVADCKMYGLVQGGPDIDVRRCDQLLERGRTARVNRACSMPCRPWIARRVSSRSAPGDTAARGALYRTRGLGVVRSSSGRIATSRGAGGAEVPRERAKVGRRDAADRDRYVHRFERCAPLRPGGGLRGTRVAN